MAWTDTIWVITLFGEDLKFWGTVAIASILKWLFTKGRQTLRDATASVLAGAALAYYGHTYTMRMFDIGEDDKSLVIIGLVFMGEHVVRAVLDRGPSWATKKLGLDTPKEGS